MNNIVKAYKVKTRDHVFFFDDEDINKLDLVKTPANQFHVIHKNLSVGARLVKVDVLNKNMTIEISGEIFSVEIKDALDQELEKMGFGSSTKKHAKEIKAPMPGLVLEIAVSEGLEVSRGDKVLILEAMKMENSITVVADSKIKKILVVKGQVVDKGQVLVELE